MVRAFKFLLFTLGVTQILQAAPQQTPEPLSQKAASKFEISTFKMSANDEIYKIFYLVVAVYVEISNIYVVNSVDNIDRVVYIKNTIFKNGV